jgi:hypothetical protein
MARAFLATLLPLTACTLLVACGDDPAEGESGSDSSGAAASSTGGEDPTNTTPATTPTTTTGPTEVTSGDDASGTSGEGPTTDPTSATDPTGDPDTGDTTTGEPSPYDGEPLPAADPGTWTWIDFPEAKCRDGSGTGIGVRYGTAPGLVIFFEGGGACFNALTCGANPANYGMSNFTGWAGGGGQNGIFDISNDANPVADWSYVYVPYCTGDVHAGARPDGTLPDNPTPQQFVGYLNIGHFLQRVVPTFLGQVDHVLVTGVSAGGFGAAFNYDRIADAFPGEKVTLLDDSGPPMSDEFMATCLQKQWREAWGLDDTMPADCANCFPADGGGIVNLGVYLGEKHKGQKLALISSLGDNTIRFFFGFGNNDCTTLLPNTSEQKFTEGLHDLRDNWMSMTPDTWGTFFLSGQQHTWIGGGSYTTAQSGGVLLLDWITELIGGNVSNVEP